MNLTPPVGAVDLAPPVGAVDLAPPVGVVDLAPPVGVVDLAPPVGVVNLTPPVAVVDLAPPVGVVNLAPPVGVVNLASPVGVVVLAPPVGVVNLAPPVGVVDLAPPVGVVNTADAPHNHHHLAIESSTTKGATRDAPLPCEPGLSLRSPEQTGNIVQFSPHKLGAPNLLTLLTGRVNTNCWFFSNNLPSSRGPLGNWPGGGEQRDLGLILFFETVIWTCGE